MGELRRRLLGYDRRQVERVLNALSAEVGMLRGELEEARSAATSVDRIGAEVGELLRALANGAAEVQQRAENEAARILAEAEARARGLLADAERKAPRLHGPTAARARATIAGRPVDPPSAEDPESLAGTAEVFRQLAAVIERAQGSDSSESAPTSAAS